LQPLRLSKKVVMGGFDGRGPMGREPSILKGANMDTKVKKKRVWKVKGSEWKKQHALKLLEESKNGGKPASKSKSKVPSGIQSDPTETKPTGEPVTASNGGGDINSGNGGGGLLPANTSTPNSTTPPNSGNPATVKPSDSKPIDPIVKPLGRATASFLNNIAPMLLSFSSKTKDVVWVPISRTDTTHLISETTDYIKTKHPEMTDQFKSGEVLLGQWLLMLGGRFRKKQNKNVEVNKDAKG